MNKRNWRKELRLAGDGEIYVCGACGRTFKDPYSVDVSCMLNRVLCYEDSLEYDEHHKLINAKAIEEK